MTVTKTKKCPKCKGYGRMKVCPTCNGQGEITIAVDGKPVKRPKKTKGQHP